MEADPKSRGSPGWQGTLGASLDSALTLIVGSGDYWATESQLGSTGQIARKIAFDCSG